MIVEDRRPPFTKHTPFKSLIERCWASLPADRPTAAEALQQLNEIFLGEPVIISSPALARVKVMQESGLENAPVCQLVEQTQTQMGCIKYNAAPFTLTMDSKQEI